jgi:hypothetical protein
LLSLCAKTDKIIRNIGEFQYNKHSDNELNGKHFASKAMRLAARLLLKVQELDKSQQDLTFYRKPHYVETIKLAAIALAGNDVYTNVPYPSTLKHIGYDIKRYAEAKAIKTSNKAKVKESGLFLKLFTKRWRHIASSALKQLQTRKFNKEVTLPSSDNLKSVTGFIKSRIANPSELEYKTMADCVEARLLMFNKRLPGELVLEVNICLARFLVPFVGMGVGMESKWNLILFSSVYIYIYQVKGRKVKRRVHGRANKVQVAKRTRGNQL